MKPAHRVCGGVFTPDPDVPPDPIDVKKRNGIRYCVCGLRGQAGDAHHSPPEAPEDAQTRAAGDKETS